MPLRTALIVSALALAGGFATPAFGARQLRVTGATGVTAATAATAATGVSSATGATGAMGVFGPVGPIASAAETPEEQAARGAREERERKEQFERETEKASENGTLHCVVPKLTGYSLARASEALQQSHCHLGLTNQPAGRHRGRLIVTGQRPRAGSDLVAGSAVSVTLGRAHRRRARRT